jgi:hypothetical protein
MKTLSILLLSFIFLGACSESPDIYGGDTHHATLDFESPQTNDMSQLLFRDFQRTAKLKKEAEKSEKAAKKEKKLA